MKKTPSAIRIPTPVLSRPRGALRRREAQLAPALLVVLALGSVVLACGSEVTDVRSDGDSTSSSADSGSSSSSTGTMGPMWPRRITLVSTLGMDQSDGVQLADGAIVVGDGDLSLFSGKMLSVRAPVPASVCAKGKYAALGDVPAEIDSCPGALSGTWEPFAYLSATTVHSTEDSYAAGLGLLLRDKDHAVLYRARVVGDSYDAEGMSTATLDYEPVP
jgi:hypothetical protein